MIRGGRGRRLAGTCVALLVSTCVVSAAAAESAAAPTVIAGFLYNFAKFTEWPAESLPAGAPLVLCVVGDPAVWRSLEQAGQGHEIDGHPVAVWKLTVDDQIRSCHLVYAGGVDRKQAVGLLGSLKGVAIFTVSDLTVFTGMGGTAHLFIEQGRMHFAVNVESAQRAGLRLSSKLLILAKIVKGDPNAASR